MRLAIIAALLLAGCGASAPNPYPAAAKARFEASCPPESAVCACTWDHLTRTMTYEQYEAALARFRDTGLMEPEVTRARTRCLERHRE
ncbi:hypothetical protein U91I_02283 [alpha proteobacterium U9-1i]|nr:hypothetical protein U91I_02283 [alpha proteobacterium U9-1i]